jgi:long-chain acyl-CoA synthetase
MLILPSSIMREHLATLIDDFRSYGGEIAVVRYHGNRRRVTSYGEIARLAGRFAALLAQRKIETGDRVVIWGDNSAEWIAAFYGCMLRGVLAVPLDSNGTADFAGRVAADVSPKLAVGDAVLLNQLPEGLAKLALEDWLSELPEEEAGPVEGLKAETPLQILFTSGTTGDPKGIVLTHGNVLASVGPIEDASQPYLRYERLIHPLRILHTLPLSHVFGQTMGLWVPPIYRAELHFESRLVAPRLVEMIRRERISVLAAVPRVLALLKAHLESTVPGLAERVLEVKGATGNVSIAGVPGRWWRFRQVHRAFGLKFWAIISGGGALQGPLEHFWNAVGLVVVQGYGMTETTAIITLNHPFHVAEGTLGKPLAGREVKLGPDGEVLVRGASISGATWSGGALHAREDEWLATGDLAEEQATGELRFLGRKSEVIVTASGMNLHPEDIEAEIDREPGVFACAVVGLDTASGPVPCAVLAFRGTRAEAALAIEHANARLAEFQRILRWELWPEPDLPRTSTGKVKRKAVAKWLAESYGAATAAAGDALQTGETKTASTDWLLTTITQITGETPPGNGNELRLAEDLHLDSLGRAQLEAAIEERLGTVPQAEDGSLDQIQTLGELRRLLSANPEKDGAPSQSMAPAVSETAQSAGLSGQDGPTVEATAQSSVKQADQPAVAAQESQTQVARSTYIYPRWPWWFPVRWVRAAFFEAVIRPLVWFLGDPAVVRTGKIDPGEPMLIVANHITSVDAALLEYALPGPIRRRMAIAMSGEMLEDFRHFRNPEGVGKNKGFFPQGPLYYVLVTALFNVFPLHRQRDFQRSFAHAGEALDHGYNVMVFPEGARSDEGKLAAFRPGIGLLVKQSSAPVLPMAMRGLGDLKTRKHRWFRSGRIELRVGQPIRFSSTDTEAAITARLHDEVETLLSE